MKKHSLNVMLWTLTILIFAGKVHADTTYSNAVMSLGPLAYWQLNETNPVPDDLATNSGTLGASASGYYVGGAVHPASGALANGAGAGVQFPNISGNRVVIPYQPALAAAAPFSVELWVNSAALSSVDSSTMCLASLTQFGNPPGTGDGTRKGWLFYETGGSGWIFRTYGSNNTAFAATASQTVTAGTWYHIVGVYDGTNTTLYVNGQVAASVAASSYVPVDPGASPFSVGYRGYGALGGFSFNGNVAEVAYYTNILSPADILSHYQNGTNVASSATAYAQLVEAKAPPVYLRFVEPVFVPPATYPVAVNLGSLGTAADGQYETNCAPGLPGVPYAGFGPNNMATGFSPAQGGVIDMGASESLDFTTTPFTIVTWFKTAPKFDTRFQSFIGKGDSSWRAGVDGGSGFAHFALGANSDVVGTADLRDSKWHQMVGVFDGTNLLLYIDGLLNASGDGSAGAAGSANDLNVGTVPDYGIGRVFNGTIDEVAVFGTNLTSDQILQLYLAGEEPPLITQQPPASLTIDEGTSTTLSAEAFGPGTLVYQWQMNGTNLTGQTSTNLTLSNVHISDSGNYTLVVTNVYGSVTSSVAALTVQAGPPILVSTPAPVSIYSGLTANFSAFANGSNPLHYQWLFNGAFIGGQNATNLVLSNVSPTQTGNYSVIITNLEGAVTSSVAALTVLVPNSPYSQAVVGDAPISYWRLGESGGSIAYDYISGNNGIYTNVALGQPGYAFTDTNTAALFGQTTPSYVGSIPNIDFATNAGLPSFSLEAWVKAAPQSGDSCVLTKGTGGGGEQFNIDFGAGNSAFRFFVRDAGGGVHLCNSSFIPDGNWHHLVGVCDGAGQQLYFYIDGNLATQTTPGTGIKAAPQPMTIGCRQSGTTAYDDQLNGVEDEVAVYNYALSAQQVANHYTARFPSGTIPIIITQPTPITNYISLAATFSVVAEGPDPLTYQWLSNNIPVPGANAATNLVAPLDYTSAGTYQVIIANNNGSVTSSIVNLTVLAPPTSLNLSSGLVLHLPFDGNYADTSGRNNNGTNVGATTFVTGMIGSGALHYYTDTSVPTYNYVTLGQRPDLNFSSNVNFSVAYWIRLPAGSTPGDLPFICNAAGSTFSGGFTFAPSYNLGGWAWSLNGVGVYGAELSIDDGNWHSLVHTFDRTGNGTTYLDGVEVDSRSITGVGNIDQAAQTCIGQDPTGTYAQTGEADIDDVGIWRRALTPLEASSIYIGAESNALSFASAQITPSTLSIATSGAQLQITWTGAGTLQAAGNVTGTYTNVPGATSPYLVTPTGSQLYFRLSIP